MGFHEDMVQSIRSEITKLKQKHDFFQEETSTSADDFVREYELENDQGSLYLIQRKEGDVNCVVWDAALLLAKYLEKMCLENENFLAGKKVVELGSGLGCVGLVAAFYGGHVTMTDLSQALNLLKLNLKKNQKLINNRKGFAQVKELNWNDEPQLDPCDIILASDCIYYKESVTGFIETLKRLSTARTEIYLSQENRCHSETQTKIWKHFTEEVNKFFRVEIIPPREQHEEYRTPDIYLLKLSKIRI